MKASTFIRERRCGASWLFYAFPPDHDEDTRRPPDPPPEKKEEGAPAKERRVQGSRPPAPAGRAAHGGYHE